MTPSRTVYDVQGSISFEDVRRAREFLADNELRMIPGSVRHSNGGLLLDVYIDFRDDVLALQFKLMFSELNVTKQGGEIVEVTA